MRHAILNGPMKAARLAVLFALAAGWSPLNGGAAEPKDSSAEFVSRIASRLEGGDAALTGALADRLIESGQAELILNKSGVRGGPTVRRALLQWARKHPDQAARVYLTLLRHEEVAEESAPSRAEPPSLGEKVRPVLDAFSEQTTEVLKAVRSGSPATSSVEAGKIFDGSLARAEDGGEWDPQAQAQPQGAGEKITFADVIGIEEAKAELMEVVEMLKNPERYRRVGAQIPTGVLLTGPPGTGKTHLAKALANEAGVNFFAVEGPRFHAKFVGESEALVRQAFEQARLRAPTIIFVDEIETLLGARTEDSQAAAKGYNATVAQFLVEMDGLTEGSLDSRKPLVIVVGATNRVDLMDPAALRPGRFDRVIVVNPPDVNGREATLKYYVKKKKIPAAPDVDLRVIAIRTMGMGGAHLKNLVNEAALLAARDNAAQVSQTHFLKAVDRVVMGHERKGLALTVEEKRHTAIHELGHALVGTFIPGGDPVAKVTIIPRDMGALGVTMSEPPEDRKTWTQEQLQARIAMAMGGRVAEKMFMETYTTGASNDLENAMQLAFRMVVEFGMSEELGAVSYVQTARGNYISKGGRLMELSEATKQRIEAEAKKILDAQEKLALQVLTEHRTTLEALVPHLVEKETMEGDELRRLIKEIEKRSPGGPSA